MCLDSHPKNSRWGLYLNLAYAGAYINFQGLKQIQERKKKNPFLYFSTASYMRVSSAFPHRIAAAHGDRTNKERWSAVSFS